MKINLVKNEPPRGPAVIPQVPPAVRLPAGVTGVMPLPSGQVITLRNPKHIMPEELATLKALDWVEGAPIPSNLAQIIADVRARTAAAETEADQQFAVDPSTPRLKFKTVPIEKFTPEQQTEIKARIREAIGQAQIQAQATAQQTQVAQQSEVAKKIAQSRAIETDVVPPVRPAPAGNAVPDPNYRPPEITAQAVNPKAKPAETVKAAATAGAGAGPAITECPHCGWDLAIDVIAEPDAAEKQAFLASVLGEQVFTRDYTILGGSVTMTFRTLTTQEIDAIFKQVYRERERLEITTPADFYERVNRYRLYLQLQRIRTSAVSGFDHELPDGLSPQTNPHAACHWECPAGEKEPLKLVENAIINEVLRTETLNRVVYQHCGRFNQLVARLEALVDNSDFWRATKLPS